MNDTKPWFRSRTIWAALVAVAASLGGYAGFDADATTQAQLTEAILQLVAAAGGLTAVFGRISASSRID